MRRRLWKSEYRTSLNKRKNQLEVCVRIFEKTEVTLRRPPAKYNFT